MTFIEAMYKNELCAELKAGFAFALACSSHISYY